MGIDEIVQNLNEQIQMLEDLKTAIIEAQEETVGLITAVNNWFEQNDGVLPEVKGD